MSKSKNKKEIPTLPDFNSEDKELEFWDKHDISKYDAGIAEDIILSLKPKVKRPVTLRLDEELIEALKKAAHKHGVPYQTLAREVLRRAMRAYL